MMLQHCGKSPLSLAETCRLCCSYCPIPPTHYYISSAGGTSLMLSLYILQVDDTNTPCMAEDGAAGVAGEEWLLGFPCACGGRVTTGHARPACLMGAPNSY